MDEPSLLHSLISAASIRDLAGDRYYQRGVDYFRRGLVHSIEHSGDTVRSVVSGTEDYAVELFANGTKFNYTCECPLGEDGKFCKHCVATALAWLAGNATSTPVHKSYRSGRIANDDIQQALQNQEKQTLIDWLMEWSERDEALRQRLVLLASSRNGKEALVAQVRAGVEKAVKIRGYRNYDQAPVYSGRVASALNGVETLLQQGHAAATIELCESAMKWLAAAAENIDDSDGQMTELMERVADLHLRACEHATPEPELLAGKLFALELNAEYSQWGDTAERYAHILGDTGLAAFRTAAAQAWQKVPVRTARESYRNGENYFVLTRIMESLAVQSGDVEQLVSVLERDLTSSHQYLRIAGCYRKAEIHEKALHWAERGMACYPNLEGASLRLFVAEEYRRAERHADALHIVWLNFRDAPQLESYKLLESFARAADDWADWRNKALAHIRRPGAKDARADRSPAVAILQNRSQGHSLLVEIFLYERNIEDAWREAQTGNCRDELWLQLAAQREKTHPAAAAAIYLKHGERAIADVANGRYESAINLLEKAAALMHLLGKSQEFEVQFEALRQRYKPKRNLQKLAEVRRPFLYLR